MSSNPGNGTTPKSFLVTIVRCLDSRLFAKTIAADDIHQAETMAIREAASLPDDYYVRDVRLVQKTSDSPSGPP
jgi:hypothetical protein